MDALLDEIESLEAILMEDVHIEKDAEGIPKSIETTVFPVVGEDAEQQYVCVTLQVLPTSGYPDVSPEYKLIKPRGLDDSRLMAINSAIESKLKDSLGYPVVFDLIEVVREHLTGSNLPSGQCVVCLYGFSDGDEFTRTECFHYLHSYCLGRHINAMRRNYQDEFNKLPAWQQKTAKPFQPYCPVCRENIKDESDSLRCAMPPSELESAPEFKPTSELRELQHRMSALFLQQKSRGAIIDSEAEGGTVISIETEAEVRRRLQRKQDDLATSDNSEVSCSTAVTEAVSGGYINSSGAGTLDTATQGGQQKDISGLNPKANSTPVQQAQRENAISNNYHHGKRHFRGGRRHQHHHHNQHQSQRDRERFEHNHIPSTSTSATAVNSTSHSSGSQSSQYNNKQAKAHVAGHGHSR